MTALQDIGMLIGLTTAQAVWLIARRVRTFAEGASELTLGSYGLAILPMRQVARVASWIAGLWVFLLFWIVADNAFNSAIAALFAGFFVAYGINLKISRYEQALIQRHGVKTVSGFTS